MKESFKKKSSTFRFLSAGDTALVVEFGEIVDPVINRSVRQLAAVIAEDSPEGIINLVPTMRSLLIHYDPLVISQKTLIRSIKPKIGITVPLIQDSQTWRIPVCYEERYAPDIGAVSEKLDVSRVELIRQHTSAELEVFMMGFLPGFPYLGLLPKIFDLPRLTLPRVRVPKNSISIAARQTTVYTIDSPGGWHLIGRTPIDFYDVHRTEPILVKSGDRIKFKSIEVDEFEYIRARINFEQFKVDELYA